jgi:hypothetical protein
MGEVARICERRQLVDDHVRARFERDCADGAAASSPSTAFAAAPTLSIHAIFAGERVSPTT